MGAAADGDAGGAAPPFPDARWRAAPAARATAAAQSLLANQTLLGNDTCGVAVETGITSSACVASTGGSAERIFFYTSKSNAETDTSPLAASAAVAADDANYKFIKVAVIGRQAKYALTPIVGAISSDNIGAEAVAGLGSAICKVPPVMLCNPDEPTYNTVTTYPFDANSKKGYGIRLVGDGSYAPGNWGFLQNDASSLLEAMGYNSPPGDCVASTGVDTKTGVNAAVMDGLNTRFDVDANGNSCPGGNAKCSPSLNVRKDLVRDDACGITGKGWQENDSDPANFDTRAYKPTSAALYPSSKTPDIMGHPRDVCHAFSNTAAGIGCTTRMGNGTWDINAYWRSNYGADYASQVSTSTYGAQPLGYPTRYQVYRWEMDNYSTKLGAKAGSGGKTAYGTPVAGKCLATPTSPYGLVPGGTVVDRRRVSIAIVNCKALNIKGNEKNVPVLKWADVFLVEPSISRVKCSKGSSCNTNYSDKTDIYVEMIGETTSGAAGQTAGQVVKRDTPYLVK